MGKDEKRAEGSTERGLRITTSFPEARGSVHSNNSYPLLTPAPLGMQPILSQLSNSLLGQRKKRSFRSSSEATKPRCLEEANLRFKSGLPNSRAHTLPVIPASFTDQVTGHEGQGSTTLGFPITILLFFWADAFVFHYFRLLREKGNASP